MLSVACTAEPVAEGRSALLCSALCELQMLWVDNHVLEIAAAAEEQVAPQPALSPSVSVQF